MRNPLLLLLLALLMAGCKDSRSFETVRQLKTGMTISEVEKIMGEPFNYERLNDSAEERMYVYDRPGTGADAFINVTFQNEKVVTIK